MISPAFYVLHEFSFFYYCLNVFLPQFLLSLYHSEDSGVKLTLRTHVALNRCWRLPPVCCLIRLHWNMFYSFLQKETVNVFDFVKVGRLQQWRLQQWRGAICVNYQPNHGSIGFFFWVHFGLTHGALQTETNDLIWRHIWPYLTITSWVTFTEYPGVVIRWQPCDRDRKWPSKTASLNWRKTI